VKTIVEGTSSQFLTSLLITLPLAKEDSYIKVIGLNERPYVEMTLDWLCKEGIELEYPQDMSHFKIKGGQQYPAFDITIPADFSTAAFPLVGTVLTKGKVNIRDLDFDDHQGDKAIFEFMKEMGAEINKKHEITSVEMNGKLTGKTFDLNATPDALPVMAVAGSLAEGKTSLVNCPQARIKETDRIKCMSCELRKMGAEIEELEDGMIITGSELHGAEVESYGDHRIAMAMTIAGMAASGETIINGAEAAAVTYPSFIKDFQEIKAEIEEIYRQRSLWIETMDEMAESNADSLKQIFLMLQFFSLLAMLIASVGIVNNYLVSYLERRRVLAVIRSVGMSANQATKMFLVEALTGGILGAGAGLAGGLAIASFLPSYMQAFDLAITLTISPARMVLLLVLGALLSLGAQVLPSMKSKRLNLLEALKYE
jgi:hypothetical protein